MITNDAQLKQAQKCIELLQTGLNDIEQNVRPQSKVWYEIMAENPLDEIKKLETEIANYLKRKTKPHKQSGANRKVRKNT